MTDNGSTSAASSAESSAVSSEAASSEATSAVSSAAASSEVVETIETTEVPVDDPRPFLTTGFSDYTVSEGLLLLLIFVILLLTFFFDLIRRWF